MECVLRDAVLVHWRKIERRREERIDCYSKRVLDHARNDAFEDRTTELKAWVGVDLDEPRFEGSVDHEVQSEDFKIAALSCWVNEASTWLDSVTGYLSEVRVDIHLEVARFAIARQGINITLQLWIRQLVAWLKFAIGRRMLLDGIISKMHKWICDAL